MKNQWEENAKYVEQVYGAYVDWEERFYICPECGEPVYKGDWTNKAFCNWLCPVCGYVEEEKDF